MSIFSNALSPLLWILILIGLAGCSSGADNASTQSDESDKSDTVDSAPVITGQNQLVVIKNTSLTIDLTDLLVTDADDPYPTGFSLTIDAGANYSVNANTIAPVLDYVGDLSIPVTVSDGLYDSEIFDLTVSVVDTPVIGYSKLWFTDPIINGITINWDNATLPGNATSALEYRAYYSTINNLGTVDDILSNGIPVGEWQTALSINITNMPTLYNAYWNVLTRPIGTLYAAYAPSQPNGYKDISFGVNGDLILGNNNEFSVETQNIAGTTKVLVAYDDSVNSVGVPTIQMGRFNSDGSSDETFTQQTINNVTLHKIIKVEPNNNFYIGGTTTANQYAIYSFTPNGVPRTGYVYGETVDLTYTGTLVDVFATVRGHTLVSYDQWNLYLKNVDSSGTLLNPTTITPDFENIFNSSFYGAFSEGPSILYGFGSGWGTVVATQSSIGDIYIGAGVRYDIFWRGLYETNYLPYILFGGGNGGLLSDRLFVSPTYSYIYSPKWIKWVGEKLYFADIEYDLSAWEKDVFSRSEELHPLLDIIVGRSGHPLDRIYFHPDFMTEDSNYEVGIGRAGNGMALYRGTYTTNSGIFDGPSPDDTFGAKGIIMLDTSNGVTKYTQVLVGADGYYYTVGRQGSTSSVISKYAR